jgi:ABC-2 type transport system permease protein
MKKYWTIFVALRRIKLMRMLEYRTDFFFWMTISLIWTGFNYFYFGLLFSQGNGIEGWNYNQIMLLISFYTMIDAFTFSVFWPNMRQLTEEVFNGEMSKYLVKPVNTIFIVLTQNINYHNIPRFFVGLFVLLHSIKKLDIPVSIWQILMTTIVFIFGLILIYSLWFILATISFWVERLNNINDIMPQFRSVYQVPVKVFSGLTGFIFTYVIPLGLITTLPSEVILGRVNYFSVVYLIFSATLFLLTSIYFFNYSIKKYSSVGG